MRSCTLGGSIADLHVGFNELGAPGFEAGGGIEAADPRRL